MQSSPRLAEFIVQKNLPKQRGEQIYNQKCFQSLHEFQLDVNRERPLQIFEIFGVYTHLQQKHQCAL